jgi:hypothetical protein
MIFTDNSDLRERSTNSRDRRPIAKVCYTDSPYGVKSRGYEFRVYSDPEKLHDFDEANLVYVGHDNILSYNWVDSAPPGAGVRQYCVKFLGYFYAKFTGEYTFFLTCSDGAKLYLEDSDSHPDDLSSPLSVTPIRGETIPPAWSNHKNPETYKATFSATEGTWYPLKVEYYKDTGLGVLSVQYLEPRYVVNLSGEYSDYEPCAYYDSVNGICSGVVDVDSSPATSRGRCYNENWGKNCFEGELCCGNATLVSGHKYPVIGKKALSAGVVNYQAGDGWENRSAESVGFLSSHVLPSIEEINGSKKSGDSSQYVFSVPFGKESDGGYYYQAEAENYANAELGIHLRKGRLIEIYFGYQTKCQYCVGDGDSCSFGYDSTAEGLWWKKTECATMGNAECPKNSPPADDYVKRFTGIVTEFRIQRSPEGSSLEVVCQDFQHFITTSLNENYPNLVSYANAGGTRAGTAFLHNDFSKDRPHGKIQRITGNVINAYDNWPVVEAYRDILTHCGVDPTLQWGRKVITRADGESAYADYYIEDKKYMLTRNTNYGFGDSTNLSGDTTTKEDDAYIWKADFGKSLNDIVGRMSDQYGTILGFNEDGFPKFQTYDNSRIFHVSNEKYAYDSNLVVETTNINAYRGSYLDFTTNDAWVSIPFSGSRVDLIVPLVSGESLEYAASLSDCLFGEMPMGRFSLNSVPDGSSGTYYNDHIIGSESYFGISHDEEVTVFGREAWFYYTPTENEEVDQLSCRVKSVFFHSGHVYNVSVTIGEADIVSDVNNPSSSSWTTPKFSSSSAVITDWDPTDDLKNGQTNIVLRKSFDGDSTFSFVADTTYLIKIETDSFTSTGVAIPVGIGTFAHLHAFARSGVFLDTWGFEQNSGSDLDIHSTYKKFDLIGQTATGYFGESSSSDTFEKYISRHYTVSLMFGKTNDADASFHYWVLNSSDELVFEGYTPTTIPKSFLPFWGKARWFFDGDDLRSTMTNPTLVPIYASNLVSEDAYHSLNSYDDYTLIVSGGNGQGRLEGVCVYDVDTDAHSFSFSSGLNNTVVADMSLSEGLKDIRNDVIVVGGAKGSVINDATSEVINPNNPRQKYYFSRILDANSIYNLDDIHNIGRRSPFMIWEPAILSDQQANSLSLAVLQKYKKSARNLNFTSIGNPFLETDDCVYIDDPDVFALSIGGRRQWVESISEKMSPGEYDMSVVSASSKRWPSVQMRENPIASLFDGQSVVNVVMTDDAGLVRISGGSFNDRENHSDNIGWRVYDPYESEGSSQYTNWDRQLRCVFDVVVPGDYLISVCPIITNSNLDHAGIMSDDWQNLSGQAVAYLRPGANPSSDSAWLHLEAGRYEVYWDGIDYLFNSFGGLYTTPLAEEEGISQNLEDSPIYVHNGSYCVKFERKNVGELLVRSDVSDYVNTISTIKLDDLYNNSSYGLDHRLNGYHTQCWDVVKGDVLTLGIYYDREGGNAIFNDPRNREEAIVWRGLYHKPEPAWRVLGDGNVYVHANRGHDIYPWYLATPFLDTSTGYRKYPPFSQGRNWSTFTVNGHSQYVEFHENENDGRGLRVIVSGYVKEDTEAGVDLAYRRMIAYQINTQFWRATWAFPANKNQMEYADGYQNASDYRRECNWDTNDGIDAGFDLRCRGFIAPSYSDTGGLITDHDGEKEKSIWKGILVDPSGAGSFDHISLWAQKHPDNMFVHAGEWDGRTLQFMYAIHYSAQGGTSDHDTRAMNVNDTSYPTEYSGELGSCARRGDLGIKSNLGVWEKEDLGTIENLEFTRLYDFNFYIDPKNGSAFKCEQGKIVKNSMSFQMTSSSEGVRTKFAYPRGDDDGHSSTAGGVGVRRLSLQEILQIVKSYADTAGYFPKSIATANAFFVTLRLWDRSGRGLRLLSDSHVAGYLSNSDRERKFWSWNKMFTAFSHDDLDRKRYWDKMVFLDYDNTDVENTSNWTRETTMLETANTNEVYLRAYWTPAGDSCFDNPDQVVASGDCVWVSAMQNLGGVTRPALATEPTTMGEIFKMYYLISDVKAYLDRHDSDVAQVPPSGLFGQGEGSFSNE